MTLKADSITYQFIKFKQFNSLKMFYIKIITKFIQWDKAYLMINKFFLEFKVKSKNKFNL